LEGLAGLLKTISEISQTANEQLRVEGVLRTLYDGRNRLTREINQQLAAHFGEKLYTTVIPRNVRVAEAPSFGKPILAYDPRSQGASAYLALAGEVLRRQE
jgi:chromosome partitioning protein